MHSWPRPRGAREAGGSTGAIGCRHDPGRRWTRRRLSAASTIPPLLQLPGPTSLTDNPAKGDPTKPAVIGKPGEIETRQITIDGQALEVALRHGDGSGPPLLLFNGIGANWELAKPF